MGSFTWRASMPPTQLEAHFGDRVVRCFVDRPRNVNALFAEALARNREGEALVCGDQRLTWRALDDAVARVAVRTRAVRYRARRSSGSAARQPR